MQTGEQIISVVVGNTLVVRRIPGDMTVDEIRRLLVEMREKEVRRQQG